MNQFPATWYNTSIGEGNSICLNKGPQPFLWGDNCAIMSECTLMRQHLKTCFSWISEPISTKLGTKYPKVKGIQLCFNKGEIIAKWLHWQHLKIFSTTTGLIQPSIINLLLHINWFVQVCLLLRNVSQMSYMCPWASCFILTIFNYKRHTV